MKYHYILLLALYIGCCPALNAQEEQEVKAVIVELFDAMRAGDSTRLKAVFHPQASLATAVLNQEGGLRVVESEVAQFAQAVGQPHDQIYDEKIWSYEIRIDGPLASAWTEYSFYLGEQLSHCGVNSFQLCKGDDGWKIVYIIDTRRKENCRTTAKDQQKD